MSFPIKQTEFLAGLAKDRNTMGLVRYIAGSLAMYASVGKLIGLEINEFIPFSDIFKNKEDRRLPKPPIVGLTENVLDILTAEEKERWEVAGQKLPKIFALLFPGGTQIKKSVEGAKVVQEGGSFTKTGLMRFPVGSSDFEKAQTILFGQYSSPLAKEYYDKNRTTLGKKQTEEALKDNTVYQRVHERREATRKAIEKVRQQEEYKNASKADQQAIENEIENRMEKKYGI